MAAKTVMQTKDQPGGPGGGYVPLTVLERGRAIDGIWLRDLCLSCGADDVGFVAMDRREVDTDREGILQAAPWTKSLISLAIRMNRENIRSPMRSLANVEFHASDDQVVEASRRIVAALERAGVRAMHTAFGFPMEADRWPGKMWVVSHKLIAEAAGLGRIGLHRNVIHPNFGSFIFLGTVLIDRAVAGQGTPLDSNPCVSCKLCVAACPTGAIKPDGAFDFTACYTHNYREFMGGFGDWVESVAASRSPLDYRRKVGDTETVSLWQSLSFGSNYKAAYCLAVCPAGDQIMPHFLSDKPVFKEQIVKPLTGKGATVYVVPGSDAQHYVARRFPHKTVKRVGNGLRPRTAQGFFDGLSLAFQRGQSEGLDADFHFTLTGETPATATVTIRNRKLAVRDGLRGAPRVRVIADTDTWLGYLAKERSLLWALLLRRIRIKGDPRLLLKFKKCFPS